MDKLGMIEKVIGEYLHACMDNGICILQQVNFV